MGSLYIESQISWLREETCCILPFASFARKLHRLIFLRRSFPHSFWLSPSPSHNRYCARPHSGVYTRHQHGKPRAWHQCLPTGSRNHLQQGVRCLLYHRGGELSSTMTSTLVTSFCEMQIIWSCICQGARVFWSRVEGQCGGRCGYTIYEEGLAWPEVWGVEEDCDAFRDPGLSYPVVIQLICGESARILRDDNLWKGFGDELGWSEEEGISMADKTGGSVQTQLW